MQVTLINPPSPYLANDKTSPPLGLLYLAGALEKAGIEVEVIDLSSLSNWEEIVKSIDTSIIGVTCVSSDYNSVKRIFKLIPDNITKIVGGAHPSAMPQETLDDLNVDLVVAGEGELIIAGIVQTILAGEVQDDWDRVIIGPPTPAGAIDVPARHLIDLTAYCPEMTAASSTTMLTSRGCPCRCNFCFKMYDSNLVRYHSPETVDKEVVQLQAFGFNNIVIADDNFILNPKHFRAVSEIMLKRGIHYRCVGRADTFNEEVAKRLVDTGCLEISFGTETGSQKILDAMNKGETIAQQRDALLLAKKYGMVSKAYFVVGFPGEDSATIEETKNFFAEVLPDKWLLSTFCPFPGCAVWNDPKKFGITNLSNDFSQFWYVGTDAMGGKSFETKELSHQRIQEMNRELFTFFNTLVPMQRHVKVNPNG